ncbi:MAG: hypothetical protein MI923_02445 [Phycisphaerales bacterium]|nr:hypothetical protein [Phycisphaerales bacterium]
MKRLTAFALVIVFSLPIAGCDLLTTVLPTTVVVRLVNNGTLPVEVEVYTSDNQDITETLLKTLGTKQEITVAAGQTMTLTEDCDDLQAIVCEAKLQAVVIVPDDETNVLRDETDFECGNTITFTFAHSIILVDFNITTNVAN